MIDSALKLRNALDAFTVAAMNKRGGESQKEYRDQLAADQLKPVDWKELEELHKLLEPFKDITMALQGNFRDEQMNGAIFDVLPSFDFLLQHLEIAKTKFITSRSAMATCVNLAWMKLNDYYTLSDTDEMFERENLLTLIQ
jgi:hypothetical protein